MKAATVSIIKATAPLVSQHARQITGLFYKNMFAKNPETLQFFNQANQVGVPYGLTVTAPQVVVSYNTRTPRAIQCVCLHPCSFISCSDFRRKMAVSRKLWRMLSSPLVPILKISAPSHQQFNSWPPSIAVCRFSHSITVLFTAT